MTWKLFELDHPRTDRRDRNGEDIGKLYSPTNPSNISWLRVDVASELWLSGVIRKI